MNIGVRRREVRHLACPNFSVAELDALRSLLGLLQPYLRQPWEISDAATADVVLVNLDQPGGVARVTGANVVGCAQRPRLHPAGTVHRPLRVPELLALLTDVGERTPQAPGAAQASEPAIEWRYGLRSWPLDFLDWPRPAWRVLAILTRARHSVGEIAERAGLSPSEVESHLALLQRIDLIDRFGEPRPNARLPHPENWRGLARRVGQLLGFR
jgi:DNA-binding transcriptional ArsR family regulator